MAKQSRASKPNLADLEKMVAELVPLRRAVPTQPFFIPGLDSYFPSYVSGGTAEARSVDGQLESDPVRDQQIQR